jgi:hypothetical protein
VSAPAPASRAATRAASPPNVARYPERSKRRERALFIAGGVVGGLGVIGHIASSVIVGLSFTSSCQEECYEEVALIYDLAATVPMATGGALMGAGFGLRGRRQAFQDATGAPGAGRGMKRRGVLGWTLFGVGLGAYVATRSAAIACSDGCFVGVWEGGFWASAGLMTAGMILGPYSRGYRVSMRKLKTVPGVSVVPIADGRGVRGFALAGRF